MTTGTVNQYEINGVIDTAQNVLDNMSQIASAAGCFITWDPDQGKWSVIVNEPDVSIKSFNDDNIVGAITVSSSGVNELYNSATIEFPHRDIRDSVDIIDVAIPLNQRFPQELDNNLNIKIDCINNPVQAQLIATRELKQSRVDKIIRFSTDYTSNGLKAGDLIDVTASMYGFAAKVFRIISIEEEDTDEGVILFSITAREYDPDVYSTAGLEYKTRNKRTGIIPKASNPEIRRSEDVDIGSQVGRLLGANLLLGLLSSGSNPLGGLLRNIFGVDRNTGQIYSRSEFADRNIQSAVASLARPAVSLTVDKTLGCNGDTFVFSIQHTCNNCFFSNPQFEYDYAITGVAQNEINVPLTGKLTTTGNSPASLPVVFNVTGAAGSSKTATFTVGSSSRTVTIFASMPNQYVSSVNSNLNSIIEGNSVTFTVNTVGYANGTTLPYTLGGTATLKVSSPALTGNITINSNTATLVVNTTDDAVFGVAQSLTLTVGSAVSNPCATTSNSKTVTVANNDTTGPEPPPPPPDTSCSPKTIPLVWCGIADGATGEIKSVFVQETIRVCSPQPGQPSVTVPTAVSVARGNPSTITITATTQVSGLLTSGGQQVQIITAFNPAGLNQTVMTGTTVTVVGF